MANNQTSAEVKAKIILDEANLAFSETAQRKDKPGARTFDGSCWDPGNMEGEYDEEDFQKILEMQLRVAQTCDNHPELEEKTAEMFPKVNAANAEEMLKEILSNAAIRELTKNSVAIFLLRFPTVQSYMSKGHPLVLAADDYMLENANQQNWHDYYNIAQDIR